MSVVRGFGLNGKSIYMNIANPKVVMCNFIVDATNGNGLGIRSLKSNGYIENVFMHTSATPGSNLGHLNPNPASGIAVVTFKNNFNKYLGGFSGLVSTVTGGALTATVANVTYVITALGTATLAQWQAVGFPVGFVPAVGASFVATASATIGGSAAVMAPGVSSIDHVEVIGDPNLTLNNSNIASNAGAQVLVQFVAAGVLAAPAAGAVVGMSFWFDGSSVTVDGL